MAAQGRIGPYWLTYRELAEQLPAYAADMGFTHVELLPVSEHPFDGSWGYQPTGLFAPTSRFGSPADFVALVERCTKRARPAARLGARPFPRRSARPRAFRRHRPLRAADPRQGRHLDWGTLIYNYGRVEVHNFLIANALFWLDRYGIDGLRVDAVASMLYLDYSRPAGGWVPNKYGGRENIDAISFLRRTNTRSVLQHPHATTAAEESTAWPMVSRPVDWGGLGFGYKWNMGWMHDTLDYISKDPIYRRHHHGNILFGLHYAFSENFILPLSHDEVVHGERSIFGRMPGDEWQRFANLRAYYAFMFGHPGKKLMFMGSSSARTPMESRQQPALAPARARSTRRHAPPGARPQSSLPRHAGAARARLRRAGFEWLVADDANNSTFAWLRKGKNPNERCVVVVNFTPQVLHNYRVRVPFAGKWREVLNSDAAIYGGSNVGNTGAVSAVVTRDSPELHLVVPPLAAVFFVPEV